MAGVFFCFGLLLPRALAGPPQLPPSIEAQPPSGPFAGGNRVVVTNISFAINITNVTLSGVPAAGFAMPGAGWFWFVAPATGSAGLKDIVMQTPDGEVPLEGFYTVNPAGVIPGASRALPALVTLTNTWLDGTNGVLLAGVKPDDKSGFSVGSAGDVNGDGCADLLVGAYAADPSGRSLAGETCLVYGRSSGLPALITLTNTWLDGTNGVLLAGATAYDNSGRSVSSAGDVNGDGYADLLVGASGASGLAGETYLVYGCSSGLPALITLAKTWFDGTNGVLLAGVNANDNSGRSVSSAGDVNGDGFADLLVGANGADPSGRMDAGETYLVYGRSSGLPALIPLANTWLDGTNGVILAGSTAEDYSGRSVSSAGDVNGDGYADLLVGAYLASPSGLKMAGATYLVYGRSNGLPALITLDNTWLDGTNGVILAGVNSYDSSGVSVGSAGDVNGDGFADLLVGASDADPSGRMDAGETYLVYGRSSGLPALIPLANTWLDGTNGVILAGANSSDKSGISVGSAGDVNGDGCADLLVGAYAADPSGRNYAGETYLVYGRSSGLPALITLTHTWFDGTNGVLLAGAKAGDYSGWSVGSAGDANGDGYADLLVGAHLASPSGPKMAGATYLVYGGVAFTPVLPASGALTGGYQVVISGTNLCNGIAGDVTGVTLAGVAATVVGVGRSTQVVVMAGSAVTVGVGDVRVYSTSRGETVSSNAFTYLKSGQAALVFSPASPQAYGTTNALAVSGGSGTGAVSFAVLGGPGLIVDGTNLSVTAGSGEIEIRATRAQDDLYDSASVTGTVAAVMADQAVGGFLPANGGAFVLTDEVGLSATASSGLGVSFAVRAGDPGAITGFTNLVFTGTGSVSVVASQAGDTNWNVAADVTNTFRVYNLYVLAVSSAHGTADPVAGVYTNVEDMILTNSMTPPAAAGGTQLVCLGWAMTGNEPSSGTGTLVVMTVTNSAALEWLWRTNYWLQAAAVANGSVDAGGGWQPAGETARITAAASPHYHFIRWTGDAAGEASPLDLLMDAPKAAGAEFAANLTANTGTPEWWLAQHYPGADDYENAAVSDTDGDGSLAWQEWVALTSPTNGLDCLRIENFSRPSGLADGCALDFIARTGRLYRIDAAPDLLAPGWVAVTADIEGGGGLCTVPLALPSGAAFYRITVRLPPVGD